jgi:hypothetical protein
VHLRDVGAGLGAARRADVLEAQVRERRVVLAVRPNSELGPSSCSVSPRSSIQAPRTSGRPAQQVDGRVGSV